jgi:hypothetical protein
VPPRRHLHAILLNALLQSCVPDFFGGCQYISSSECLFASRCSKKVNGRVLGGQICLGVVNDSEDDVQFLIQASQTTRAPRQFVSLVSVLDHRLRGHSHSHSHLHCARARTLLALALARAQCPPPHSIAVQGPLLHSDATGTLMPPLARHPLQDIPPGPRTQVTSECCGCCRIPPAGSGRGDAAGVRGRCSCCHGAEAVEKPLA